MPLCLRSNCVRTGSFSVVLALLTLNLRLIAATMGETDADGTLEIEDTLPVECEPEWEIIANQCYYFDGDSQLDWFEAQQQCAKLDATLPSVHNLLANDYLLYNALQEFGDALDEVQFWIGLVCQDNGTFAWMDSSPFDYSDLRDSASECTDVNMAYYFMRVSWKGTLSKGEDMRLVCSKAGTVSTGIPTTSGEPGDDPPVYVIILIGMSIILGFILLLAFIIFMYRRRSSKAKLIEIQIENGRKMTKILSDQENASRYYNLPGLGKSDEWEIERRFVSIDYSKKLGDGAFGSVYLGRVLSKNIPTGMGRSIAELAALTSGKEEVAVKMLHENADASAERDFRAEIELMKRIGYYDRLVNILACVTQLEPILLLTEYCSNGDLLGFMRERREYMLENTDYANIDEENVITAKKQLMFAIQIAYGMEYLSTRGYVHRDLAARNIMVDAHETCKIGDFGLCREIAKEDELYFSHGGKLPLKWMSPEAMDKYQFSVASDVWSYGILLFEIVTLGGAPYADWPATELLTRLKNGDRMDRPENCSDDMFEVMSHCWAELPDDRPTFTKLRKRLGVLLEDVNQDDYYLKLNAHANYYEFEKN